MVLADGGSAQKKSNANEEMEILAKNIMNEMGKWKQAQIAQSRRSQWQRGEMKER